MDSMLIWIVMFAGAAIALLAVFLVASEKELKKKRLEIDQLLTNLGDSAATVGAPDSSAMTPAANSREVDELRLRNQDLERDLAAVSSKPQSGASIDEDLELAQRNVEIAKSNAQWLQTSNDELKAQVEDLKTRLEVSQARTSDVTSDSSGATDRQRDLEHEVAELREQLAQSRSQSREIGGMEHKLANAEAIESNHREEKMRLEFKITELEKELSAQNAARSHEVESLREQLAESDRMQQRVRDEQRGLEQEMSRWQGRAQEAEEHSRQISALRDPFENLLAKQSALEERQREYREAMAGFSQLIAKSNEISPQVAGFNEFHAGAPIGETHSAPMGNGMHAVDATAAAPTHIIAAAQAAQKPKRRFGLFPVVIALLFAGSLVALFWGMQGSDTTTTANALPAVSQNKAPTSPDRAAALPAPATSEPIAPQEAFVAKEVNSPAVKEKAQPAKTLEVAKVQQPFAGTYEITQSSRVYAAPSELSQQMGDIEPGVRVNVVNSKNGWLEIHSKHGRPPGFIRKESARVLAQN
ncbi:MAG: hypothetical protein ACREPG_02110 [Candidatus Binatia bacterium]